jgi:hypothetical protein
VEISTSLVADAEPLELPPPQCMNTLDVYGAEGTTFWTAGSGTAL